jgi:hypothetical protein
VRANVRVECYSGYKADERPVGFHLGDREYLVRRIVDQWYSPHATYFRLEADDGNLYILRHDFDTLEEAWTLESFQRARTDLL